MKRSNGDNQHKRSHSMEFNCFRSFDFVQIARNCNLLRSLSIRMLSTNVYLCEMNLYQFYTEWTYKIFVCLKNTSNSCCIHQIHKKMCWFLFFFSCKFAGWRCNWYNCTRINWIITIEAPSPPSSSCTPFVKR